MRVKRFTAPTMKDAIRLIKTDLGDGAIILATKKVKTASGATTLEITAAVEQATNTVGAAVAPTHLPAATAPTLKNTPSASADMALIVCLRQHGVAEDMCLRIEKAAKALGESGFAPEDTLEMVLGKMLPFVLPAHMLPKGAVHVFVGPNGVGKTTTISKLAVQKKMAGHSVALASMDFQKVAGYDQLATFAGAMNTQAFLLRDAGDYAPFLNTHTAADFVLIDTPGINPLQATQVQTLLQRVQVLTQASSRQVLVHLVLPASMDSEVLALCPAAFYAFAPHSMVITKLDETLRLGPVVNVAATARLQVCYMTDGARVPYDIVEMDSRMLAEKLVQQPAALWEVIS